MFILTENLYFLGAGRTGIHWFFFFFCPLSKVSYYLRLARSVHIHLGAIFKSFAPFSLIQAGDCHGTNLSSPYINLFLRWNQGYFTEWKHSFVCWSIVKAALTLGYFNLGEVYFYSRFYSRILEPGIQTCCTGARFSEPLAGIANQSGDTFLQRVLQA